MVLSNSTGFCHELNYMLVKDFVSSTYLCRVVTASKMMRWRSHGGPGFTSSQRCQRQGLCVGVGQETDGRKFSGRNCWSWGWCCNPSFHTCIYLFDWLCNEWDVGESVSKTSPVDVGEDASPRTHFRKGPYRGGGYERGGASCPGAISERGCIVARSN